jgi:hypothetical protein
MAAEIVDTLQSFPAGRIAAVLFGEPGRAGISEAQRAFPRKINQLDKK